MHLRNFFLKLINCKTCQPPTLQIGTLGQASVNPLGRPHQNTHLCAVSLSLSHTHTLHLFGLVVIDDIDPHSSRMCMNWCHGLLLWNLETPSGHNSSHLAYMRSLQVGDKWTLNMVGIQFWSVVKGPTECFTRKAGKRQEDSSSQRSCNNAPAGLNEPGLINVHCSSSSYYQSCCED